MNNDFIPRPPDPHRRVSVPPRRAVSSQDVKPASSNPESGPLTPPTSPIDVSERSRKPQVTPDDQLQESASPITLRKKSKWKKWPFIVGVIILVVAAVCAGLIAWYNGALAAVDSRSNEKIAVVVPAGTGTGGIAQLLRENGLIRSEDAFMWYVRLNGKTAELQSGSYRLAKSEDVPTIVSHLTSGKTDTFSITFLPGDTLQKHRQRLIEAGYDASIVDAALQKQYSGDLFEGKPADTDLEGYIYGETYQFPADATPEQILERTFDEFESAIKRTGAAQAAKDRGLNLYQAITLASVIQREVVSKDDMAQVSQIFQLRYARGMPLGSDVTYQYIADKTGQVRDTNLDSPYNTRRYAGLPPGPIASPGIDALVSVGKPANGDFVYFLSGDDDKTYYARTNEEHEQNIRDHCQKKCQII